MIHLNINSSSRLDLVGDWHYEKNIIQIGPDKVKTNDIRHFEESELNLKLICKDDILLLDTNSENESITVNGMRTIGRCFLKVGDTIKVQNLSIEIVNFKYNDDFVSEKYEESLKKIVRGNHPINQILDIINNDLKGLS